jgi:hypothetical protein
MLEPNPPKVVAPTSGDTITLRFKDRFLFVNKDATLAALTVKLPWAPQLGDLAIITSKSAITALTLNDGAGDAISGAPGAVDAGGTVVMQWVSKALGWKTSVETTGIVSLGSLGVTATAAEVNYNDIAALGTGAASKTVALSSGDDYVWPATGILTYGVLKDPAGTTLGATAAEINNAADVSARVQTMTVSGAVTAGVQSLQLNHATVVIAATIADAANHPGLFVVKDLSATGTAAHTLTLTAGTFNGTNNVATFNARDEALIVYFDSVGRGAIVANIGSVALS